MRVVICGSGVIGACTAYFLSRRGIDVTVVERTEVAAAASGKAGGFLALDWCSGSPLDALAQRSFALHAALCHEIAGDWGYRRMTAYSGFVVSERDTRRHKPAALEWLWTNTQLDRVVSLIAPGDRRSNRSPIFVAIRDAQRTLQARGELNMAVTVGPDGVGSGAVGELPGLVEGFRSGTAGRSGPAVRQSHAASAPRPGG